MTEPLTDQPGISTNGRLTRAIEPVEGAVLAGEADSDVVPADDSAVVPTDELPPGTPRWVKVLGIALVVLLLAFAGLHLTGNVPMHMAGGNGVHNMPLP